MKAKLIKPDEGLAYDITEACSSVTWSGSVLQASRSVELDYINAPYDTRLKIPPIATGNYLSVEDQTVEIFWGQFFGSEVNGQTGTITHLARDPMKCLLESTGKYNFKNVTPEAATAQVCADVQMPVGELAATGINIKSMLCNDKAIYDIIMGGYTQAYRMTGKRYLAYIINRKLSIIEQNVILGGGYYLSDQLNITDASVQEKADEIINSVRIYNSKGKQIGEVRDEDSIRRWGVYQSTYDQEKGVDAHTAAKNMLKIKPEQTIMVSGIGDINCISGRGVVVKDGATGLSGLYWIKSDKHIWSGGTYTMELELTFDKLMDEMEIEVETEKKKGRKS